MQMQAQKVARTANDSSVVAEITRLAATGSVEVNVQDLEHLADSRALLAPGTRVYVSHLPNQTWDATRVMCDAVRASGFEPVPHMPVRLVDSAATLDRILAELARSSRPREVLLISGDYPAATGPFATVAHALDTGALEKHGFEHISVAGHPEGHPTVALDEIRRTELEKPRLAASHGLGALFVTQFLFEVEPFVTWANELRSKDVRAQVVCGLAGPAKITTLFRFAMRCGVGPSIRALGARPSSVANLLGDHGPDRMLRQLAEAHATGECHVEGIHFFGLGGYLRTARWISKTAAGAIRLKDGGGFDV